MALTFLPTIICSDKTEAFCRFRDFMCSRNGTYDYSAGGAGWTLWDSSYAVDEDNPAINDYFVMYSSGETGDDDIFVKITWVSGYFWGNVYLSWDPTTHEGSTSFFVNVSNTFTLAETANLFQFDVHTNLDSFFVSSDNAASNWYGMHGGGLQSAIDAIDGSTATCASALTAGSDVSITVDTVPTNWEVGRQLFIRTTHTNSVSTAKMEIVVIKTLVSNTITVDLVNNYTAGNKLAVQLCYVMQTSNTVLASYRTLMGGAGTVNGYVGVYLTTVSSGPIDPTAFEDRYMFMTPYFIESSYGWPTGLCPFLKNMYSLSIPLLDNDTVTALDGSIWRVRKYYSNKYLALREA